MNWIATFYDKNDNILMTINIKDRTEHEAENQCQADIKCNSKIVDWSLVEEGFFDDQIIE